MIFPMAVNEQVVKPARAIISGSARGRVVFSNTPLSFLMGVDLPTGVVVDAHHPLRGTCLRDCVLVIPSGRGSCSASGAIIELILAGVSPVALIFQRIDEILALGVLMARAIFDKSIPIIVVEDINTFLLFDGRDTVAEILEDGIVLQGTNKIRVPIVRSGTDAVSLSPADRAILNGSRGSAAKLAMEMVVAFAVMQGATSLVSVTQVHIDACIYVGESSLLIPQHLASLGGRFIVPATCNSLSVDRLRWKQLGGDPARSQVASQIGDLYLEMGADMSFTCAPYLLDSKPDEGAHIGWAESNAVVFANSVLGARTQKYPDYLDVFIGLTGRAPMSGCHSDKGRAPTVLISVPGFNSPDDSLFPLLGYHIGQVCGSRIPFVYGLELVKPSVSDLKAFGAGFATTSSAAMFHIGGVTPEALKFEPREPENVIILDVEELTRSWKMLNSAIDEFVHLVSLGNPHFSLEEFRQLVTLCKNRRVSPEVKFMITTSRYTYKMASACGFDRILEEFGAIIITDTCWCMIEEPIIPLTARNIMTNSAKYAHYGPGMLKRGFHFGSLESCVDAACFGRRSDDVRIPPWLLGASNRT